MFCLTSSFYNFCAKKKRSLGLSRTFIMSSEDEDWEYYDDATTLTDLWQYLKDESLEDDPLDFWQKQPSSSDLELQVHDYWRIKVPLVLAPGYGYTSVDQPVSQEKVKNSLIQPLEAFICGTASPREIFEV